MLPYQMPPTPPDYFDAPLDSNYDVRQRFSSGFGTGSVQPSGYELGQAGYNENLAPYTQRVKAPVSHGGLLQDHIHQFKSYPPVSLPREAANAPRLPPIKDIVDDRHLSQPPTRPVYESQPKEEKTTGGVAAYLDYDMEMMIDFVSETAHGLHESYASTIYLADIDVSRSIVNSKCPVSADFRKFVSQVLTSTRLPQSTILLGLCYLASRMTMLSSVGVFNYGNGCVRRMLTVALLLGSKFLDDNTFQNKSWSEVSTIPVKDINELELEWLEAIGWRMHLDPDKSDAIRLWFQRWDQYKDTKTARLEGLVQTLERTRLEGDFVRQQQMPHQRSTPNNHKLLHYDGRMNYGINDNMQTCWSTPRYGPWSSSGNQLDYSPPSAPETGPNTPQWYGANDGFGHDCALPRSYTKLKPPPGLLMPGFNVPQIGNYTPYTQQYNPYDQDNTYLHGYCRSQYNNVPPGLGYGPQFVVG